MAFFQMCLSYTTFFQLRTFILPISSKTSSSQCVLGLPIGLLDMGFHLLIFWTLLSSMKPTRCTNFTNLFCHETLHVLNSSSVQHQEFIHCTLSNGKIRQCQTGKGNISVQKHKRKTVQNQRGNMV